VPLQLNERGPQDGLRQGHLALDGRPGHGLIRPPIRGRRYAFSAPEAADKGPRDPKRKKREEALKAFRAEKAAARKVTGSVVLTNPLVEALARDVPADEAALAAVPWFGEKRLRLYGAELLQLLRTV
jgi:ribonuclease D